MGEGGEKREDPSEQKGKDPFATDHVLKRLRQFNEKSPKYTTLHSSAMVVGGVVLLQPLDVIRTKQQMDGARRTIPNAMREVWAQYGLRGFWKGIGPELWRTIPGVGLLQPPKGDLRAIIANQNTAMQLQLSQYLSIRLIARRKEEESRATPTSTSTSAHHSSAASKVANVRSVGVVNAAFVGGISKLVPQMLLFPTTIVKTRLESGLYQYESTPRAIITIFKTERLRGLFTGALPTLMREVPYSTIHYPALLTSAVLMSRVTDNNFIMAGTAAFSASCFALFITHPFDVLKTRFQLAHKSGEMNPTFRQTVSKIYHSAGIKGFFAGFLMRAARKSILSSLAWSGFILGLIKAEVLK